jgi:hypothetical protein
MRALLRLALLLGGTLAASACSWSRFDDLTDDSPVVLLEKPDSMNNGFGVSLATATNEGHTQVLVGGTVTTAGAALYEVGQQDAPDTQAIDANYCSGNGKPCFLSSLTAGFANAQGPDQLRPLCYAAGTGEVVKQGLVVRCRDASQYTLDIPPLAQELLSLSIAQNQPPHDYPMATDRTDDPALLASLPERRLAWFYPEKSTTFSELTLPDGLDADDPSFGRALAVLALGGGRVLALGVPGKMEVLLWKTDHAGKPSYIGCLRGGSGMGRALAAGTIEANGGDDLVISDDGHVQVVDGDALFGMPGTTSNECVLPGSIPGALKTWFDCKSTNDLADCEQAEFGAALAVGDLDGDGDGELIVGAPKMTARGQKNAGSLLVYDIRPTWEATLVDTKFMSSAESGDELGRSIVTPHAGKRDIIAAGAPGHGKAALFYCSSLLANGMAGAHCP